MKELPVEIPRVPNFIRIKLCSKHTDREKDPVLLGIEDFTDEELREIGKEWTETLVALATKRRNAK